MKYELHPDESMGLVWLPNTQNIGPDELLHAFPITDDERSREYLSWRDQQKPSIT